MLKTPVGLYQEHISDLANGLKLALEYGYDLIVTHVVNPLYRREFITEPMKTKHLVFSRSDLILQSPDWLYKVVSIISNNIDCDSEDEQFRKFSENTLVQELSYANHLIQHGFVLIRLNGQRSVNLARIVSQHIKGTVMFEVPMVDPKSLSDVYRNQNQNNTDNKKRQNNDTWTWWNKFRTYADFHANIGISLEISADIPSSEEIQRWLCEPILSLIIPSSIFIRNAQNYPVLTKAHQSLVGAFLRNNTSLLVKCSGDDGSVQHYADYLKHLGAMYHSRTDPMQGFDDVLEIPLQPLYDNLDSYTYEVFEKDPIKYLYYQKAIEKVLIAKVPEAEINNKTIIIMVVGAGRGPIVRAALNAAQNTKRKCRVYIVEKNPNAVITLTALCEELWPDKDIQLISCDMRDFTPPEKVDILVSELLGSFGDNELSPECLDGAQIHLKEDGVSIPSKSTSYINPIMSPILYEMVRTTEKTSNIRDKLKTYTTLSESSYVVYIKRAYHIDRPKALFEFVHPNKATPIDNTRYKTLRFDVKIDCVLNGFAGYFDTILYEDITLSIHPETHSMGMPSWFPIYFPVSNPIQLKAGDEIEVNFWRCVSSHQVWYEWSVSSPSITHIHNHGGRHCPIYK